MARWITFLERSAPAEWVRESTWAYPTVEIVHIAGFVVLVGAAVLFDLRLLGFSRSVKVTDLVDHLLPWSRRATAIVVPSGFLLFMSDATPLAASPVFRLKLLLIGMAAANALVFHRFSRRGIERWNLGVAPPAAARAHGVFSLIAWAAVISCGRLLAYY